jgi:hypothetical protein
LKGCNHPADKLWIMDRNRPTFSDEEALAFRRAFRWAS